MKKALAFLLAALLLVSLAGPAWAEDTKEYRDEIFAFRYPASWSMGKADNGDIVLGSPDGKYAALAFGIISDLMVFTGDPETDGPLVDTYISSYSGKNLALSGEYEFVEQGEMRGFRALGSWRATGQDAVMLVLSGNRHVVGFIMVGDGAIALEQDLADSVELLGEAPAESSEGFSRWDSKLFSVDYPTHYGTLEQNVGVIFVNAANSNCVIVARTYDLNSDYDDSQAVAICNKALPTSTKITPDAIMTEIGGKNAAVIKGSISSGPLEFYIIGKGRTVLALMFTGDEAIGYAEAVIRSAEIK